MTVETKIEFDKYLRLMYILLYRKPATIFITFIGLVMLITSLLYFSVFNIPFDSPPFFQIIFGFIITFLIPYYVFRNAKNSFSSNNKLLEKVTYEFTEDEMKISGESFYSVVNWEKTHMVVELNSWILIYQNKTVCTPIPKESFGEKLNNFRNLIRNKSFIIQKLKN